MRDADGKLITNSKPFTVNGIRSCRFCKKALKKPYTTNQYCSSRCIKLNRIRPRKCKNCRKSFKSDSTSLRMYCSTLCRTKYNAEVSRAAFPDLPTGTVGAIGELVVSSFLMAKGFQVFRALSPSCFCDIIIAHDNVLATVEVRTGYLHKNGSIYWPLNYSGSIDIVAITLPAENKLSFKAETKLGKETIKLYKLPKLLKACSRR